MIIIRAKKMEAAENYLVGIKNGMVKALVPALNRAASSAKTTAVKKTKELYYGKSMQIKNGFSVKRAGYKKLTASIIVKGEVNPLTRFKVQPSKPNPKRKKPIVIRVIRGQGKSVPGVFVARMKSGHIGVYERTSKKRTPIRQKFGPATPQMVGNDKVIQVVEQQAQTTLHRRLEHEVERVVRRDLKL